ncbi:hypothetical protein [Hydrogenophaga sp.]|uniref:hypothetical protein n=1 Tax=Hydrogenophaga sp. TaxID=1904254 RepID=UPI002FC6B031
MTFFIVDSSPELNALHRVFREAKFSAEPDDDEIADSPQVNAMFLRVMDAIIEQSVKEDGEAARQRWANWLAIDKSRDEWGASALRARQVKNWAEMNYQEKSRKAKDILCPFTCTPQLLAEFISQVDADTPPQGMPV